MCSTQTVLKISENFQESKRGGTLFLVKLQILIRQFYRNKTPPENFC